MLPDKGTSVCNNLESSATYAYLDVAREDILRMIPSDGRVIGSVGCGYAGTEARLIAQGRDVHGVDVSEAAIQVAGTRLTSARVVSADDGMPFQESSLDGLILADVLEHIPKAWNHLVGYAKMVKPGGWVVISVPNMRHIEVLATLAVRGDWPEAPMGIFDETHIQIMTHKRLIRWREKAQLQHDRWYPAYDYRRVRRNVYRTINGLTLGFFNSFLMFEVQGVFRRI